MSVLIKGFLNWLKGLWESFIQKQKHIDQGRKEVLDEIEKQTEEFKNEAKKTGKTNTDLTVDDITRRLRERFNRATGVSGTTSSTS
jgi:hypothetical protein